MIDGQENPAALSFNSGIFDVNKNFALTEHMMQDNMIVIADAVFQRLTPELRTAVVKASREMEDDIRAKVIADDAATKCDYAGVAVEARLDQRVDHRIHRACPATKRHPRAHQGRQGPVAHGIGDGHAGGATQLLGERAVGPGVGAGHEHGVDLVSCVSSALRRGIVDEREAARLYRQAAVVLSDARM